jgi:hypothetical protein
MRHTRIADQVLFVVDRLGRLTADERSRLLESAEAIARSRRSNQLGVRHLMAALGGSIAPIASAPEDAGDRGSPELAQVSGPGGPAPAVAEEEPEGEQGARSDGHER